MSASPSRRQLTRPYEDIAGRPRLRPSWVYYLDALGTKEASAMLTEETLRRRLAPESWYHRYLHHGNLESRQAALYFTDNVVVAAPADEEILHANQILASMLIGVADYVVGMALDAGLAYRGGVSFGPAFVASRVFVNDELCAVGAAHGAAIIEAVGFEEEVAKYPRVALAPSVIDEVERRFEGDRMPVFAAPLLRDNSDDTIFVDHLGLVLQTDPVMIGHPSDRPMSPTMLMAAYREFVLRGLERADVNDKYIWLARYFNATIGGSTGARLGEPIPDVGELEFTRVAFGPPR